MNCTLPKVKGLGNADGIDWVSLDFTNRFFLKLMRIKRMWHFWGTDGELSGTPFRVEGIHLETGKKEQVLVEGMGTNNEKNVWEYSNNLAGPNNGADRHLPSGMKFGQPGKWKLNVFIGGKYFDSVIVDVKKP